MLTFLVYWCFIITYKGFNIVIPRYYQVRDVGWKMFFPERHVAIHITNVSSVFPLTLGYIYRTKAHVNLHFADDFGNNSLFLNNGYGACHANKAISSISSNPIIDLFDFLVLWIKRGIGY